MNRKVKSTQRLLGALLTIDLCGHTINGVRDSNALFLIKDGTTLTVKDSVGGGKIIHTIEEVSSSSNAMFSVREKGTLVIENGTYILASPNTKAGYIISGSKIYSGSNIYINGGEFRNETG